MARKSYENKKIVKRFRVTEEQNNLLLTMTMLSGCSNFSDYVLKRLLEPEQEMLTDFIDTTLEHNISVQKQLFMLYKLNVTILLELTKAPLFIQKISQENKDLIQRTIDIYKDQADKTFKSTKGEEKIL